MDTKLTRLGMVMLGMPGTEAPGPSVELSLVLTREMCKARVKWTLDK